MTGDHLGLSVSVTKKRVSKGVLPKGAISPDSIKTRHKTKPANFYLTNAPIACVARPALAVVKTRCVCAIRIYVAIMSSLFAFVEV